MGFHRTSFILNPSPLTQKVLIFNSREPEVIIFIRRNIKNEAEIILYNDLKVRAMNLQVLWFTMRGACPRTKAKAAVYNDVALQLVLQFITATKRVSTRSK